MPRHYAETIGHAARLAAWRDREHRRLPPRRIIFHRREAEGRDVGIDVEAQIPARIQNVELFEWATHAKAGTQIVKVDELIPVLLNRADVGGDDGG